MSRFIARIKSFLARLCWLSRFVPTPLHALYYLLRIKLCGSARGRASYKGVLFEFMPRDMSAIREVLADQEYQFLKPLLKTTENPVIIDAGAHIGLFALWVLGENKAAQILSLEASPETFATLSNNNQVAVAHGRNWQIVHGAAWDSHEEISFAAQGESMGHRVSGDGGVKVKGVSLQDLMDKSPAEKIDLLKVDIEGAEEKFLTAGEEYLPRIKNLVIELHDNYCDTASVENILRRHYKNIDSIGGRLSTKPLLHCYN